MDIKKYISLIIIILLLIGNIFLFIENADKGRALKDYKEEKIKQNLDKVQELENEDRQRIKTIEEKAESAEVIKKNKKQNWRNGKKNKVRIDGFDNADSLEQLFTRRYREN